MNLFGVTPVQRGAESGPEYFLNMGFSQELKGVRLPNSNERQWELGTSVTLKTPALLSEEQAFTLTDLDKGGGLSEYEKLVSQPIWTSL